MDRKVAETLGLGEWLAEVRSDTWAVVDLSGYVGRRAGELEESVWADICSEAVASSTGGPGRR